VTAPVLSWGLEIWAVEAWQKALKQGNT